MFKNLLAFSLIALGVLFSFVIPGNPHSVKPEPKVSPEKISEFACLKTPEKKYEPLSVVTG